MVLGCVQPYKSMIFFVAAAVVVVLSPIYYSFYDAHSGFQFDWLF